MRGRASTQSQVRGQQAWEGNDDELHDDFDAYGTHNVGDGRPTHEQDIILEDEDDNLIGDIDGLDGGGDGDDIWGLAGDDVEVRVGEREKLRDSSDSEEESYVPQFQ